MTARPTPAPHKCSAEVYRNGNPFPFACGKTATLEHDGKKYCKTHYPPTVQAKRVELQKKKEAKFSSAVQQKQEAAAARKEIERRAECYPDLLAALQALVAQVERGEFDNIGADHPSSAVLPARAAIARAMQR